MALSTLVTAWAQAAEPASAAFRELSPGVEYAAIQLVPQPAHGDGQLHVVRIDPARARLRLLAVSQLGGELRTAGAFCDQHRLLAAVNAGMFETDYRSHTGYLRVGTHLNQATWVPKYRSALLLDPRGAGLPRARIVDLAPGDGPGRFAAWGGVAQNLRLIAAPGRDVWSPTPRRWSEAALAEDREGRILLLFTRTPFSMPDFNAHLLRLPLGIVRAQHAEGGPEASLSVRASGLRLDLAGSFETGFHEDDLNPGQLPLPVVLGVEAPALDDTGPGMRDSGPGKLQPRKLRGTSNSSSCESGSNCEEGVR